MAKFIVQIETYDFRHGYVYRPNKYEMFRLTKIKNILSYSGLYQKDEATKLTKEEASDIVYNLNKTMKSHSWIKNAKIIKL